MAFSNGTYSLFASGNPVVTGTTIASTWANNTLNDIATALTALGTSVATGLSAAGTNQATATQVTSVLNVFTTVASGTGAKLSSSAALDGQTQRQVIFNGGSNALTVYPATGQQINSLTANAGHILQKNSTAVYYLVSTTQWVAVLSA
jgi:hypothetical protein